MIDIILDCSDACFGVVESSDKYHMTIKQSEWAPGLWCGAENSWVEIRNPETQVLKGIYLISKVFLDERKIQINNIFGNIQPGDAIYPYRSSKYESN